MQIRECFFYKYGPEELFEFVRNKLKAEDRYDRAEWNKKDVVKKCKVPTEVNSMITAVRQLILCVCIYGAAPQSSGSCNSKPEQGSEVLGAEV